jgi:DNA-binding CsgD family transcriptional regulator
MSDDLLTYEEFRVLGRLAEGYTVEAIAHREKIGERKTQYIIGSIYRKLGAINAAEAVAQAFIRGVLSKDDISLKVSNFGRGGYQRLAPREHQALDLISQYSPEQVAEYLGISRGALRIALYGARCKLNACTNEEAIETARRFGYIK